MPANKEIKEETEKESKKSNKTLIIIIVAVIALIVIAAAVVAVILMNGEEQPPANTVQQSAPQAEQRASSKPREDSDDMGSRKLSEIGILYPLDTFTVNLKSDAGQRYLKATISLELNGQELSMELDNKSPVIRDRIIRILSSKTLEEISSKKGKQKVSEQIIDTLNSMITDGSVKGIYFTEFVIQ
ncbi:MAG: flagellar protein FliL [Campylobacterota bacterium]|nr:flagellar protein FliL [Campylobacterota bacterium]MDQ1267874.1 flagellar protein FliL [Campylobacterota bacterium]MDQ1337916.1 flagellar protein FliL [Campylobacterota bacterium]